MRPDARDRAANDDAPGLPDWLGSALVEGHQILEPAHARRLAAWCRDRLGRPCARTARFDLWRLELSTGAGCARLHITLPRDPEAPATLTWRPPERWVDASFAQRTEGDSPDAEAQAGRSNGGRAIARRLLARLKRQQAAS